MNETIVIALDGPAGAGKSTVGERLAAKLGYFYFDTGALYRAAALKAIEMGVDPADERAMSALVKGLKVVVRPATRDDGRQYDVILDGRDVSHAIRGRDVDALVSPVAASPAVRSGLIDAQRRQVQGRGTVMAGRDIGTVVCPDADLKVYLDASPGERARRRQVQVGAPAEEFDGILRGIEERDRLDATRTTAPLAKASDAVVLMTDGLSIDQVVDRIVELLEDRLAERGDGARPDVAGH